MPVPEGVAFQFDAFISYSRVDRSFAETLEHQLEEFVPPTELHVPQRRLNIFRDEADMTGAEYHSAVNAHLDDSRKLIVICSPAARRSRYVDDEIRSFASTRGAEHIIVVLFSGLPNNEVKTGAEALAAFPGALCEALEMPLAISWRGWDSEAGPISEGLFRNSWYALLANLYGVSRSEIERRDAVKRARDRAAVARERAADGMKALETDPELALLLAAQAVDWTYANDRTVTLEAEELLHRAVDRFTRFRTTPRLTLTGHTGALWNLAYSPDGSRVITVSEDGSWRLWDAATGELQRTVTGFIEHPYVPGALIEAPSAEVKAAAFSPDGRLVLTAQLDKRAKLWNVESGKGLGSLFLEGSVWDVAWSPDGTHAATASTDGTATVWDLRTGDAIGRFSVNVESLAARGAITPLVAVAFSPDGGRLATAGKFADARIWDIASGDMVVRLEGHEEVVHDVTFSPDGERLATASEDGTWRIWDAATGAHLLKGPLEGATRGEGAIYRAVFSRDGNHLATACRDKTASVWSAHSGRQLFTLGGHQGGVWGIEFSPDGRQVATASYDRKARVWDASPHQDVLTRLCGHQDTVASMAFSPDGQNLVTASWDRTARVWDVAQAREILAVSPDATVHAVAFAPGGAVFATANGDGTVRLWDATTGAAVSTIRCHDSDVIGVAFSPDGLRFVSAGGDGLVRTWNVASQQQILELDGGHTQVVAAAWSPDGSRIVTAASAHEWDLPSPANSTAKIWDADSGQELLTLAGHDHPLMGVAFSPRGSVVATSSQDHTARLWDVRTGRQMAVLEGHMSRVSGVAISPDGARIATASFDRSVKLWDTTSTAAPITLPRQQDHVWTVAFSPDGRRLAVGGKHRDVVIYTLDLEALTAFVRRAVHRHLTEAEQRRYGAAARQVFADPVPPPTPG